MTNRGVVWIALVCGAAGCSFSGSGDPSTTDGPAGDDTVDARVDAGDSDPDARPDAPGLDTDGDGIADTADNCPNLENADQANEDSDDRGNRCDACPHIAGALVIGSDGDADADGIGDQCDPRVGADTRVVFLAFDDPADLAGFTPRAGSNQWSVSGGRLHQNDTAHNVQELVWSMAAVNDVVVQSHVRVNATPSPGQLIAGIIGGYFDDATMDDEFVCGLRAADVGSANRLGAWHYLDPPAVHVSSTNTPYPGSFVAGATNARLYLNASDTIGDGSTLLCGADAVSAALAVPGYIPVGFAGFRTLGVTASYDYLFVVAIGL
jgi:hypothetical protein